jgi:hypothetical protein
MYSCVIVVHAGQLEIVLGGWVMSDAAVTYYNDIIDQHTLGFDFIQETLGPCAQSRVAWHVDQFGHSREHAAIFAKVSLCHRMILYYAASLIISLYYGSLWTVVHGLI